MASAPGNTSSAASPLFRLIEIYQGTFAVDEADYKEPEAWLDIVKILNCGYMRGLPVLRSEKQGDTYEPRAFDVFGPKIIANRSRFDDRALESRCLTLQTLDREIRRDIPRQLPPEFSGEALKLRNKLLRWRMENHYRVRPDESKLLHLDPRLTQIRTPIDERHLPGRLGRTEKRRFEHDNPGQPEGDRAYTPAPNGDGGGQGRPGYQVTIGS